MCHQAWSRGWLSEIRTYRVLQGSFSHCLNSDCRWMRVECKDLPQCSLEPMVYFLFFQLCVCVCFVFLIIGTKTMLEASVENYTRVHISQFTKEPGRFFQGWNAIFVKFLCSETAAVHSPHDSTPSSFTQASEQAMPRERSPGAHENTPQSYPIPARYTKALK